MNFKIGIQLAQLREKLNDDMNGTIKMVADAGYDGVEYILPSAIELKELKKCLDDFGLEMVGTHNSMDRLVNDIDHVIEENKELDARFITCSYNEFSSLDEIKKAANLYNRIGKKCKENGLQFLYHNHFKEFGKIGEKYKLDLLYEHTDHDLVMAQIDVYFVKKMGLTPEIYLLQYEGRCPTIHMKDIDKDSLDGVVPVGTGALDVPEIIKSAGVIGTGYVIVELGKKNLEENVFDTIKMCNDAIGLELVTSSTD